MEYAPLLDIMEQRVYRASDLETILLTSDTTKSSDDIAYLSGVKLEFITKVSQGLHNNEVLDHRIIERIVSVL